MGKNGQEGKSRKRFLEQLCPCPEGSVERTTNRLSVCELPSGQGKQSSILRHRYRNEGSVYEEVHTGYLSSCMEHGPLGIITGWNSKEKLPGNEGTRSGPWKTDKSGQQGKTYGLKREGLLGTRPTGQHPHLPCSISLLPFFREMPF